MFYAVNTHDYKRIDNLANKFLQSEYNFIALDESDFAERIYQFLYENDRRLGIKQDAIKLKDTLKRSFQTEIRYRFD